MKLLVFRLESMAGYDWRRVLVVVGGGMIVVVLLVAFLEDGELDSKARRLIDSEEAVLERIGNIRAVRAISNRALFHSRNRVQKNLGYRVIGERGELYVYVVFMIVGNSVEKSEVKIYPAARAEK